MFVGVLYRWEVVALSLDTNAFVVMICVVRLFNAAVVWTLCVVCLVDDASDVLVVKSSVVAVVWSLSVVSPVDDVSDVLVVKSSVVAVVWTLCVVGLVDDAFDAVVVVVRVLGFVTPSAMVVSTHMTNYIKTYL